MPEIVAAVKVISAALKASKIFQAVKAVLQVVAAVQTIVSVTKGRPKGLTAQRQADVLQLTLGEGPREALFGEVCTGGALEDVFNWGTTNEWEVQVITVADHVCEAAIGYFVGDVYRAWTGDGAQSGYSGALEIYFFNGSLGGTAQTYLINNSGGRWTFNDTMSGCAGFIVAYKFDEKVWPSGRPSFKWVMRGAKLYDPRKDSTVTGGSGAHRWNNPATYEWTDNAAIAAYNYRRGIYTNGQLLVGPGRSASEAPPEPIIAAANVCDELVTLKAGGTEKRYRVGCVVAANETWLSVEEKFAEAMAGDIVERAGSLSIDVGVGKTVVYTFTDDDLVADTAVTVQAKIGRRDLVNTVASTFVDPTKLWQAVAGPLRRSLTDITTDGEARELPIELEYVTSGTQAQRIAEIVRRKARLQRTAVVTLGPEAMLLEAGDWVTWTSARYAGGTARTYVISSVELSDDLRVTLQLREIASSVYSWTAATDQLDSLAPSYTAPGALGAATLSGFNATAVSITGAGGSTIPAISATWTAPTDASIYAIRLEWRKVGDTNTLDAVTLLPGAGQMIVAGGITSATDFEIRGIAITDPVRDATPTAWRTVTSGALAAATAGVASSITGQGALATANFAAFGSTVRRADGTTVVTDAAAITSLGTAAAISGQGDLATTNRAALPFGANAIVDDEFRFGAGTYWRVLAEVTSGSIGASHSVISGSGFRYISIQSTGVGGGNITWDAYPQRLSVNPGDAIQASCLFGRDSFSGTVEIQIIWHDAAGAFVTNSLLQSSSTVFAGGSSNLSTWGSIGGVAVAPAGARAASLYIRRVGVTNANGQLSITRPLIGYASSGQTAVAPWTPGLDAERGANVTETRTAAAISGQGALATKSTVATVDINANAVTSTSAQFNSASMTVTTSYASAASVTITAEAGDVIDLAISGAWSLISSNLFPSVAGSWRIVRNGSTVVYETDASVGRWSVSDGDSVGGTGLTAANILDTPGAGSHTYTLEVSRAGGFGGSISRRFLRGLRLRR